MTKPLVSVIMPCSRAQDLPKAIKIFQSQDFPEKELIIVADFIMCTDENKKFMYSRENISVDIVPSWSIGWKRNRACELAEGKIILHQDSDDYYAPDWITRSFSHLVSSDADTTGLDKAYFCNQGIKQLRKYEYEGKQPYAVGATLCYYKRVWERNKFPGVSIGEDTIFCANAGRIKPHKYINGFMAAIHGNNTASHNAWHLMTSQNYQIAEAILKI